jgi:hypothetical protein
MKKEIKKGVRPHPHQSSCETAPLILIFRVHIFICQRISEAIGTEPNNFAYAGDAEETNDFISTSNWFLLCDRASL